MNEYNLNKVEKQNYDKLDRAFRKDLNLVKLHASNHEMHELAKAKICYWLIKNNKKFVTEARLISGGRADIFNLTDSEAIEVMYTEIHKKIEVKKSRYGIYIKSLDAMEVLGTEYDDLSNLLG